MSGRNKKESTDALRELEELFEYETDEELNRKRGVYRSFIVRQTEEKIAESAKDLDFNEDAYKTLSKIVHRRQKARERRERLKEILQWAGLFGPLLVGLLIGARSHSLQEFLETVSKILHVSK